MSAILKQTARFLFSGLMCPPPKSGAKGGGGQTEQEGPEEQDYEELDDEYGTGCAWNCKTTMQQSVKMSLIFIDFF